MSHELTVALIVAFWIGSIPFGWIIAKAWGIEDLRKEGSSNVGATNVVRTAGWVPGALTFLLDFAKSIFPMLYFTDANIWVGLCAVAGHCFSPFLSFRGGKGVSTTLGAVIAFNPFIGGTAIVVYALVLALTRTSALGSLAAMLTALCGTVIFTTGTAGKLAVFCMVVIVLARHRDNWAKLLGSTLMIILLAGMSDFRGKPVEPKTPPRRVAALMPSLAETVVELGLEKSLVAAPDYARLPDSLKNIVRLGPYNRISVEAVYSSHPDLVLASMDGNDRTLVEKLEQLGLKVVTVNTQSLSDIVKSLEIVAASLGASKSAQLAQIKKLLTRKPKAITKDSKRVFIQVGWEPLVTVSDKTFIDDLLKLAGGINVFADAGIKYPRPNAEEVIARNPDVIIICQLTDEGSEAKRAREFWERFKNLKAVKQGKIHVIPGDWITKPSFVLAKGLRELENILL